LYTCIAVAEILIGVSLWIWYLLATTGNLIFGIAAAWIGAILVVAGVKRLKRER